MMATHRFHPLVLAFMFLLLSTPIVRATVIKPVTLDELTDRAELIFEGVVTHIDYRMSEQDTLDQPILPYTFVTFSIDRILKGSSLDGDTITLRFEGGPADDGKLLFIPGMPLFDLGDHDIVFARDNGSAISPIVGWGQGRFRIVRGELFSDEGVELHATAAGSLVRGHRREMEEVSKNWIGNMVFETVAGGEDAPDPGLRIAPERGPVPPRLSVEGFENLISGKVRAGHGRGAAAVRSADVRARIVVPAERPAAPPDRPDR